MCEPSSNEMQASFTFASKWFGMDVECIGAMGPRCRNDVQNKMPGSSIGACITPQQSSSHVHVSKICCSSVVLFQANVKIVRMFILQRLGSNKKYGMADYNMRWSPYQWSRYALKNALSKALQRESHNPTAPRKQCTILVLVCMNLLVFFLPAIYKRSVNWCVYIGTHCVTRSCFSLNYFDKRSMN